MHENSVELTVEVPTNLEGQAVDSYFVAAIDINNPFAEFIASVRDHFVHDWYGEVQMQEISVETFDSSNNGVFVKFKQDIICTDENALLLHPITSPLPHQGNPPVPKDIDRKDLTTIKEANIEKMPTLNFIQLKDISNQLGAKI